MKLTIQVMVGLVVLFTLFRVAAYIENRYRQKGYEDCLGDFEAYRTPKDSAYITETITKNQLEICSKLHLLKPRFFSFVF
jgi:hypothetical protein